MDKIELSTMLYWWAIENGIHPFEVVRSLSNQSNEDQRG